jgi:hypothetical protein
MLRFFSYCLALVCFALRLPAQAPTPGPDTIVFVNGDKLAGHFVSSSGASVKFKSDVLGDITVDWSKVKELHTSSKVAVIRKGVELRKHSDPSTIPQGTLSMENQNVQVVSPPQPPQSIPVSDTSVIIGQPSFEKALNREPGFLHGWTGAVTLGGTFIHATQDNETFNGAISLVRAEPEENWIAPRNRTIFDFSASYGELSQPGTPTVKTSIFHGDAERDEYLSQRMFVFGEAVYDHNFSQGLDLQQVYGGGLGWTVIQDANQTLDLKGGMSYIRQQFQAPPDQDLIGSTFAEHYKRKFKRGLVADEQLSITPAWNNTSDYSAAFSTLVAMPVYKHLSASTGIIDTFLNDPPAGFKKNSFQFTLGLTFTLQH